MDHLNPEDVYKEDNSLYERLFTSPTKDILHYDSDEEEEEAVGRIGYDRFREIREQQERERERQEQEREEQEERERHAAAEARLRVYEAELQQLLAELTDEHQDPDSVIPPEVQRSILRMAERDQNKENKKGGRKTKRKYKKRRKKRTRRKIKGGNNDQKTPEKRQRRRQERRRQERRRMGIITPPLSPQTPSPIPSESPEYIPTISPSVASSIDIQDGIVAEELVNALNQQNLIHVEHRPNIVPPLRLPPPRLPSPPVNTPSNNIDTKNRPRINIQFNRRIPSSDTKKSKLHRQIGGKKTRKNGGAPSARLRLSRQLRECRRRLVHVFEENTELRRRIAELLNNPEAHEGGKKTRKQKGGMSTKHKLQQCKNRERFNLNLIQNLKRRIQLLETINVPNGGKKYFKRRKTKKKQRKRRIKKRKSKKK